MKDHYEAALANRLESIDNALNSLSIDDYKGSVFDAKAGIALKIGNVDWELSASTGTEGYLSNVISVGDQTAVSTDGWSINAGVFGVSNDGIKIGIVGLGKDKITLSTPVPELKFKNLKVSAGASVTVLYKTPIIMAKYSPLLYA